MLKKILVGSIVGSMVFGAVASAEYTPIIRMEQAVITDYSDYDIVFMTECDGHEFVYTLYPTYPLFRDIHNSYRVAFFTNGTATVEDDQILWIYPS